MTTFNDFALPKEIKDTLTRIGFTTPTPVQEQAIPPALQGRDILGSAQTGTGKTAAFGLPLLTKLIADEKACAMVMTPTRELASQVLKELKRLAGERSGIKTALLIGGDHIGKQFQQLKRRPQLIVGTPGRINDHLERRSLNLNHTTTLVLDETDRMLDMGFTIQIERILKHLPSERQTLLFSATLPKNIVKITDKYLKDPVRVSVGVTSSPAKNITQEILRVSTQEKYESLLSQLNERDGSIIMFMKTKRSTDKMAERLNKTGFNATAIHGDLRQNKRERVIRAFRNKKYRILVATDVAARGLDIPHIEHVINYDLPQCPEDYIHRIGRTARAGAEGAALSFVTPADRSKWNAIDRLMNPDAKHDDREERSEKPRHFKKRRGSNGKPFDAKKKRYGKPGGASSYKGKRTAENTSGGEKRSDGNSNSNNRGKNNSGAGDKAKSRPQRQDRRSERRIAA